MATDNDSLWRAAFVARQTGAVDSTIISLTRDSIALYRGLWSVPPDTAVWACYYRAEDMWENVSYMPPEGPANPWIMHVGVMDAAREREMASTDFRFTLYPNPSNEDVTFVVNGVPSSGRIGIEVFDILGRRVAYVTSSSSVGGVVRLPWDTRSVSGVPLPSGMYYVHISSANRSAVGKFVVLK
jgi:hypothetical protein